MYEIELIEWLVRFFVDRLKRESDHLFRREERERASWRANEKTRERIWIEKKNKCDDEREIIWNDEKEDAKSSEQKKKIAEEIKKWRKKKEKKEKKSASQAWWCDALETKCVLSFSKIYEKCSSYLVSIWRDSRSSWLTRQRDLNTQTMIAVRTFRTKKKKERIIDDWWKKRKRIIAEWWEKLWERQKRW